MSFKAFKQAVRDRFEMLKQRPLYRSTLDKDTMWATYLASFPPGSNPLYRERSEHDCSACKNFIRDLGGVVAIIDGKIQTVWDLHLEPGSVYQPVTDALSKLVKRSPIENIMLHTQATVGLDKNHEQMPDGSIQVWEHFHAVLPSTCVEKKDAIGTKLSESRAMADVMLRGLVEIEGEAVDTVLELIAQNSLYRGEEHSGVLKAFQKLQKQFWQVMVEDRAIFVWANIAQGAGRIRNTVIGTLLVDLSEGKELDEAVKSFEAKVAPTNYKRPTSVVTKAMIEKAKQTVEELGLTSALERRYAMLSDVSVNNIIFADRSAKRAMRDNVFDQLADNAAVEIKSLEKVEEIGIQDFIEKVLPKATSLEVMVENCHLGNLVSLVAPVDPAAKQLFKWGNGFSWSYTGDVTDAIKDRVKNAGGVVDAELCCRLAWWNTDDLDFHMVEPDGHIIMFQNRRETSRCGGCLDVDANGADGMRQDPCENIYYKRTAGMKRGTYALRVHQYAVRNRDNVGFEVEVDIKGARHNFVYSKAVKQNEYITVAEFEVDRNGEVAIRPKMESTTSSKEVWGIKTHTFSKANVVMFSPNHWDDQRVGNRHFFFMLDGCANEGQVRGFYNEFLLDDLTQHRKVLEMVGSRMKVEESPHQLSGLGFSSTQRNHLFCKVQGAFSRAVKVLF